MPDDACATLVVDASVAAKRWFDEPGAQTAVESLERAGRLIAPDFLVIEMASIAAKRVRRGLESSAQAELAVLGVSRIVDRLHPSGPLAHRAFELARDHGVSAYDGLYLALAEREQAPVLTADTRLVEKACAAGLGHLVEPLS